MGGQLLELMKDKVPDQNLPAGLTDRLRDEVTNA